MATPTPQESSEASGPSLAVFQSPKLTTIDLIGGIRCHICCLTFGKKKEYDAHYSNHSTGADVVYTCVSCHKEIPSYSSFQNHCYLHVTKDKFKCKQCSKSFSKLSVLKDHVNAVHTIKCKKKSCNKKFRSQQELHVHEIVHKNDGNNPPYKCQTCDQVIESLDTCEIHVDDHCQLTYSCPICNENITKENGILHLSIHFGDEIIQREPLNVNEVYENSSVNVVGGIYCSLCEKQYKNRLEFDSHFPLDHAGKDIVYACNICEKQYREYSRFGSHCYDHVAQNKFQCDVCDRCFPRLSLLVIHTEAYHSANGDDRPFKCTVCDSAFKGEWRLREHLMQAHGLQSLKCKAPGCDKEFSTPKELIHHQNQHRTPVDNWCRQCGLEFKSLTSCFKHLELHKKKRYICPVCTREYAEKHLMMKHIPQHFESVFHMCKVCGKIYTAKNRLVEHVKTHSSVKSYECKICGKGFVKTNHLQQHLNLHTGYKPYKCVACPKEFASYPNWHKHLRKVHKIDAKTIKKPTIGPVVENAANSETNGTKLINETKVQDVPMSGPMYDFVESDQSTMDSDSITSVAIEKGLAIFDSNIDAIADDFTAETSELPENIAVFVTEASRLSPVAMPAPAPAPHPERIPCEYGPDFINAGAPAPCGEFIDLDDHLLPHIDPNLTVNAPRHDNPPLYMHDYQYEPYDQNIAQTIDNSKWEPVITKIYSDYYGNIADMSMLPVLNTDIF